MILIFLLVALFLGNAQSAEMLGSACSGDLLMIVTGFDNSDGQIKFDLDDKAQTFKPQENGPPSFMKGRFPIKDKKVEYVFKNVPCGEYAIKLYHDANMNQDLDKNAFNIPKEKYGFSNCKNCMLPPSFEIAKVLFNHEHSTIKIEL